MGFVEDNIPNQEQASQESEWPRTPGLKEGFSEWRLSFAFRNG